MRSIPLCALVCVLAGPPISFGAQPVEETRVREGHFIVLFKEGAPPADRGRILAAVGTADVYHYRLIPASAFRVLHPRAVEQLRIHPRVVSVAPDLVTSPRLNVQSQGSGTQEATATASNLVQVVPAGVNRIDAEPGFLPWTGAGIGVAVVDTGIDSTHPDLMRAGQPAVASECFYDPGLLTTSCDDIDGHGTHVAGIIGASNNDIDVVGVAPEATLYAVNVCGFGSGGLECPISTIMKGLEWIAEIANLVQPPIRVVNQSLGHAGKRQDYPSYEMAVRRVHDLGISVVTSAMNAAGLEVTDLVPQSFPWVMNVANSTAIDGTSVCKGDVYRADSAAFNTTDGRLVTSGEERIGVTISAPGWTKNELVPLGSYCTVGAGLNQGILSLSRGGGTREAGGTSMSAPHVSGVIALMWQSIGDGPLAPEVVRDRIRDSADLRGVAPLDPPPYLLSPYTFDGEREGILWAPGALSQGVMKVASIEMSCVSASKGNYKGRAAVRIVDRDNGRAIAFAYVDGTWTGAFVEGALGTTDPLGVATITTIKKASRPATFTFTVTDVAYGDFVYDPSASETSDTITCGG